MCIDQNGKVRQKALLVVGKVLIFLFVTKMAKVHKNKMKEAGLA
jgi:hypothetical protein